MKRNIIETIFGGVILIAAVIFVLLTYSSSNLKTVEGYDLIAKFSNLNGINLGSDVTIGGYKIGSVTKLDIEEDFFVKATLRIENQLMDKLPTDSIASVSSPSLMGDKVIAIEPGVEEDILEPGDEIVNTRAGASIEQLIGQFIFSLNEDKSHE